MPIGSFSLIYHLAAQLQKHRPKHVLDLGVGYGLTGAIVRQYLDDGVMEDVPDPIVNDKTVVGAPLKRWKTMLQGVEGFEGYRNPQWGVYDHISIIGIEEWALARRTSSQTLSNFDFIVLSDVLEHFDKEIGRKLVHQLMNELNPGGVLLIGTPGVFVEQGPVHGNEYERHKSLWAWNEFPVGFEVIKNGQGDENGHYMILVKYVKPK